jgi:hypothetical protein
MGGDESVAPSLQQKITYLFKPERFQIRLVPWCLRGVHVGWDGEPNWM